jgi:hypothetical protein
MPDTIYPLPGLTRLEQLDTGLASAPYFLDLAPLLRAPKPRGQLYYLRDTHWSGFGANVGFAAIMRAVAVE